MFTKADFQKFLKAFKKFHRREVRQFNSILGIEEKAGEGCHKNFN